MTKRRLIKYLVTGLTLFVLGVYWAFSYFFFNPFEGKYEYDLSTLIPRDVDFYAAKSDLRADFDPFPRPACTDAFLASPHGQALLEFESVQELLDGLDLERSVAELETALQALPIEIDPLDVFAGEEVAVAGYFGASGTADDDWAVYARASGLGKLGVEAIRSGLVGLEAQNITLTEGDDVFQLSGGALPRPIHVTRLQDVVVLSTRADLASKVREFDLRRGENSFGQSAQYANHIAEIDLDGDEMHVYVDQRALLENLSVSGALPNPRSGDLAVALAGRLFQLGLIREAMLSVSFGTGLTLQASGSLSSENMTPVQKRFYRQRGFEKSEILEVAKMAPQDVGLFLYGQGSIKDVLTELSNALDDATLSLLEDAARDVWGYPDLDPLAGDVAEAFEDRVGFLLRDYDYPPDTGVSSPPADDAKVAAWAAIFAVDNADRLAQLREQVRANQAALGIRGRDPNRSGVFTNEVQGGGVVYEFHSVAVPGTGHLATIEIYGPRGTTYFLVSNSHQFLGQVFVTYRGQGGPPLAEHNWFQTLVNAGLPSADLVAWANPRAVTRSTREITQQNAELDIALGIDWSVERPRIEREVLSEHFPNERLGSVSAENEETFQLLVSEEATRFEEKFVADGLPALVRRYQRPFVAAELTSGTLLEVSLDPKEFRCYARVVVPFDEGGDGGP